MSVETLDRAAALIRERVLAAPAGPWTENVLGSEGYAVMGAVRENGRGRVWVARCGMEAWETDKAAAEHIASWDTNMALAIAEWLEKVAQDHKPELVDEVYLRDCDECGNDNDCNGHERLCCWICNGADDEYATRVFYPCTAMSDAVRIAETYLRERADLELVTP